MCLPIFLCAVFLRYARKNRTPLKNEVPLCRRLNVRTAKVLILLTGTLDTFPNSAMITSTIWFPIRARDQRVWYTYGVLTAIQQLIRRLIASTPYPLALQSLISLVLLATLPSALAENGYMLSARFALLCVLVGLAVTGCW